MHDNSKTYMNMSTDELRTLRSKKALALQNLEAGAGGFFVGRDVRALQYNIHQIDVELTARFLQMPLPL